MRNSEQTIGNLIDRQKTVFVGSISEEGYPNGKAMFSARAREGREVLYLTTN